MMADRDAADMNGETSAPGEIRGSKNDQPEEEKQKSVQAFLRISHIFTYGILPDYTIFSMSARSNRYGIHPLSCLARRWS